MMFSGEQISLSLLESFGPKLRTEKMLLCFTSRERPITFLARGSFQHT